MPQTIALQRGTTSVTLDGTNKYTMFTQSGGTATRVIINGLAMYSNAARSGLAMFLAVQKSGGGFFTVGFKIISNNGTYGGFDFLPGNMNNIAGGNTGTTAVVNLQSVIAGSLGNAYTADQRPQNVFISGGNGASNGFGGQSNYEFCPAQFWIGPSDIVYFVGKTVSDDAGQFSWSFTTITES